MDSNHRPRAYQARALATWAMSPCSWLRQNLKILLSQFHSPSLIPCDNLSPIRSDLSSLLFFPLSGGDDGIRTHDPLLAGQVLSQLSYTPIGVFNCFFFQVSPEFLQDSPWKSNNKWFLKYPSNLFVCFRLSISASQYFREVTFSIERRWSSRTFRYGYLVTT